MVLFKQVLSLDVVISTKEKILSESRESEKGLDYIISHKDFLYQGKLPGKTTIG